MYSWWWLLLHLTDRAESIDTSARSPSIWQGQGSYSISCTSFSHQCLAREGTQWRRRGFQLWTYRNFLKSLAATVFRASLKRLRSWTTNRPKLSSKTFPVFSVPKLWFFDSRSHSHPRHCRQRPPTTTNHQQGHEVPFDVHQVSACMAWCPSGSHRCGSPYRMLKEIMIWSSCDVMIPSSSNFCGFHGGISWTKSIGQGDKPQSILANWTMTAAAPPPPPPPPTTTTTDLGTTMDMLLHHQHNENLCIST